MLLAFGVLLRWKLLYMLSRIVCLFLRFGIYWDEILILMAPLVLMQLVGCWLLGMLYTFSPGYCSLVIMEYP